MAACMINEIIDDSAMRDWADTIYNDWVADFAKQADPNRVFPLAIIPNTDPEGGSGRGAALREDGPARRRPRVQAHGPAAVAS